MASSVDRALVAAWFRWLDADGAGVLGAHDFARPLARVRAALDARGIVARVEAIDAADEAQRELFELVLLCVDADRSGSVSSEELELFASLLAHQSVEYGGKPPPWVRDFVRTLVDVVDVDSSGDLTAEEYAVLVEAFGLEAHEAPAFDTLARGCERHSLHGLDAAVAGLFRVVPHEG